MKTRIVRMGSTRAIHIPKSLLDESGLEGEVEISAENGSLVIRPARRPRDGWAAAFREMAERGDDKLLDDAGGLSCFGKNEVPDQWCAE